jgi:hypothetical protein
MINFAKVLLYKMIYCSVIYLLMGTSLLTKLDKFSDKKSWGASPSSIIIIMQMYAMWFFSFSIIDQGKIYHLGYGLKSLVGLYVLG